MKKFKTLLCLLCATLAITSCEVENIVDKPSDNNNTYTGDISVDQLDGTIYEDSGIKVEYNIIDDNTMDITMFDVKFAKGMPLRLNMCVQGVDYIYSQGCYTLSGDNIIPIAMGGSFEKFKITNLTGTITDENLTLDFTCGKYPVIYNGAR